MMARVARTRSRTTLGTHSGTVKLYASGVLQQTYTYTSGNRGREFCDDHFGQPWVDSPFNHKKGVAPRISLSGSRYSGGITFVSSDVPAVENVYLRLREPWTYGGFYRSPLPNSTLAAMAVANANPNRPDVDLPISIAELRELPSLLRDSIGLLAKVPGARGSARANLAVQFGLLPLVSDLRTLFEFTSKVNARENYLRELSASSKRIKRKLTVETWNHTDVEIAAFPGNADNQTSTNKARCYGKMDRTYWFTMQAHLIDVLSEREIRSIAPQLVTGTHNLTASQVYNLIPWTWLIDWFSDLGDILAAYRGGLRWQWSGLNVMYKTDYHIKCVFPSKRSGFTYTPSGPQSHAVTHNRVQPTVSIYPQWRIPFLTGRQWSILSSLLILRI